VKRRTLPRGAAAAWPLAARAAAGDAVIGFLYSAAADDFAPFAAAFHQGLKEAEDVDDRNVKNEYRWADGYYDRLPAFAADLVRHRAAVIVAAGGAVRRGSAHHHRAMTGYQ